MERLEFEDDSSGCMALSGKTYENCHFSSLELVPPLGRKMSIRDCKFLNCEISPGTCVIGNGVSLDHVVLSNLDCGDELRISAEVEMNEVVIAGSKPKELIIQPDRDTDIAKINYTNALFKLDISEFVGCVSIIGLSAKMVRKHSERHVAVQAKWKDQVDWSGLGIGPFSYWRIFIKKLLIFGADEGIFSLPDPSDKDYTETIEEKARIEDSGFQFV